jgi:23S rRNA G2069 N7-methylase RlmK/C1962 C5-methylase RlmI
MSGNETAAKYTTLPGRCTLIGNTSKRQANKSIATAQTHSGRPLIRKIWQMHISAVATIITANPNIKHLFNAALWQKASKYKTNVVANEKIAENIPPIKTGK